MAKKKAAAVSQPPAPVNMKAAGRQIALLLLPEDEALLGNAQKLLGAKFGMKVNRTDMMRWLIRNAGRTIEMVNQ